MFVIKTSFNYKHKYHSYRYFNNKHHSYRYFNNKHKLVDLFNPCSPVQVLTPSQESRLHCIVKTIVHLYKCWPQLSKVDCIALSKPLFTCINVGPILVKQIASHYRNPCSPVQVLAPSQESRLHCIVKTLVHLYKCWPHLSKVDCIALLKQLFTCTSIGP